MNSKPRQIHFGFGGADVVTLNQMRERAQDHRQMARAGLTPRSDTAQQVPGFEKMLAAGRAICEELKNLIIRVRDNGEMSTFCRSRQDFRMNEGGSQ